MALGPRESSKEGSCEVSQNPPEYGDFKDG